MLQRAVAFTASVVNKGLLSRGLSLFGASPNAEASCYCQMCLLDKGANQELPGSEWENIRQVPKNFAFLFWFVP